MTWTEPNVILDNGMELRLSTLRIMDTILGPGSNYDKLRKQYDLD